MSFISNAFAQGSAAGGAESSLMSFLPLILMFAVLYFIMIRPQMKRQKEHRNMLANMAKGDEVVTSGGIVGKVTKVEDEFVEIELAPSVRVREVKSTLTDITPLGGGATWQLAVLEGVYALILGSAIVIIVTISRALR